jgi:Rrf2 family nitric oxide-sensitive transcriptional repressor
MMLLAAKPEKIMTTEEVARAVHMSRNHLIKIVQALAAGGMVETQRGSGGGFRLARDPHKISLGEIVRLLEAGTPIVECFRNDGGQCRLIPGCKLKARLKVAREAFLRELDKTTLAECALSADQLTSPAPAVP